MNDHDMSLEAVAAAAATESAARPDSTVTFGSGAAPATVLENVMDQTRLEAAGVERAVEQVASASAAVIKTMSGSAIGTMTMLFSVKTATRSASTHTTR
jgi:hypothetical protein